MTIAITGHRPSKLGNDYTLTSPLSKFIESKLQNVINEYEPEMMITGMALGIDTMWALLAIKNGINLTAAIPCKNQWAKWGSSSILVYNKILEHKLTTIHNVSDGNYTTSCMQKRNEWMVDNCDILAAVWNGTSGGTSNCVKYALRKGREIIHINPNDNPWKLIF